MQMHATQQEAHRAGWHFLAAATEEINRLYGDQPMSEEQANEYIEARDAAADKYIEENNIAIEWSEYQTQLAEQSFAEYQARGQSYWDKQQEAQRSDFEKTWNDRVQEYDQENSPQTYSEMQNFSKGQSFAPSPSFGENRAPNENKPGISFAPAADAARERERVVEHRQAEFAEKASDQSLSQTERDKASMAGQIELAEFDAGRMHGVASRMDPGSPQNPWADKYEAQAQARDGHLVGLKESWNEKFPEAKIPVTDSLGYERGAQECYNDAKQYQSRFEANHRMGGHPDLDRHQAEFTSEMEPTESKLEQANVERTPAAEQGVQNQASGVQQPQDRLAEQGVVGEERDQAPAENEAQQESAVERPAWSRERGAQAREALQQRESEMEKGQERNKEHEQTV